MDVMAWSPRMTTGRAAAQGVRAMPLEDLLSTARVVSLHLVPTAATHRLLNARRLALMRPDSLLVNTSRSVLVDPAALVAALAQGRPGAAAVDVFDHEPLAADDPLRSVPNLLLTPHLGFVSEPVYHRFSHDTCECLLAWLRGAPLVRQVLPVE